MEARTMRRREHEMKDMRNGMETMETDGNRRAAGRMPARNVCVADHGGTRKHGEITGLSLHAKIDA